MPLFGLCQSLWLAIAVRLATGVMNGSFGSAKAAIADITDDSNRASAFSLFIFLWCVGAPLVLVVRLLRVVLLPPRDVRTSSGAARCLRFEHYVTKYQTLCVIYFLCVYINLYIS
eukprot:PhM_4_TR13932/c0_g5_i4/m.33800